MATLNYTNQLKFTGRSYLDPKMAPVQSYNQLTGISRSDRFEGLEVVVLHDEKNSDGQPAKYWLIGGTTNACWVKKEYGAMDLTEVKNQINNINERIDIEGEDIEQLNT